MNEQIVPVDERVPICLPEHVEATLDLRDGAVAGPIEPHLRMHRDHQSSTAPSGARMVNECITSCSNGCLAAAYSSTSIPNPGASQGSQWPFSVRSWDRTTSHRHGTSVSMSSWMRKFGVASAK